MARTLDEAFREMLAETEIAALRASAPTASVSVPETPTKNAGVKHDEGKAPLWWVPRPAMDAIAHIMEFGAKKYQAHNWRKGMKWTRLASAALRHLTAWTNGQNLDPETGMSHLWHAACCIAFLITYEAEHLGEDDRGF